jgi:hypothetical protein
MNVTPALRQNATNLLNMVNNPGDVSLLMRWNEDDNLSTFFSSHGYGVAPPVQGAQPFTRINVPAYTPASNAQPHGGHAEEYLIQNWDVILRCGKGLYPKTVDIVLSHVPCWNSSSGFQDGNGNMWPAGCSPKLYRLMTVKATGVQRWNFCFFQGFGNYAGGDPTLIENNASSIAKIAGHPKAQVYDMDILF